MAHKIMFVTHSLSAGGAENVLVNILKRINRTKFNPLLVLFEKRGVYLEQVPPDIVIYDLQGPTWYRAFLSIFKLTRIIRREKPDLIFSLLWRINLMAILAYLVSAVRSKLIISEHTLLTSHLNYTKSGLIRWLIQKLIKYLYHKVNLIIAVAQMVKEDLVHNFNIVPEKVKVFYNPVDTEQIKNLSRQEISHPWFNDPTIPIIISVGRLDKWKGFSYLIKAFRILRNKLPARLAILGSGPEKLNLLRLTRKLSLEQDVVFLGFQPNPYKYIKKANILVLSSRYEGCPMVLLETLVLNTPIVSTDCPAGPREIIQNGRNGILVPVADERALAEALFNLLQNEGVRKSLAVEGEKRALDFALPKILKEYESALESVLYKNIVS